MFDVMKYLGTWYELACYPSWFQRTSNYNTTADYQLNTDGSLLVTNSTINSGKIFTSIGRAIRMGQCSFKVDFTPQEKANLAFSNGYNIDISSFVNQDPNYIIDKLYVNEYGDYIFAIVTDSDKKTLYVLSRLSNPPLYLYNMLMEYVVQNYDIDRLVQVPHFH